MLCFIFELRCARSQALRNPWTCYTATPTFSLGCVMMQTSFSKPLKLIWRRMGFLLDERMTNCSACSRAARLLFQGLIFCNRNVFVCNAVHVHLSHSSAFSNLDILNRVCFFQVRGAGFENYCFCRIISVRLQLSAFKPVFILSIHPLSIFIIFVPYY